MATILECTPMLVTNDMKATKTFWSDVLGFSINSEMDDSWCSLCNGTTQVMFRTPLDGEGNATSFSGSLYMTVDAVDHEWERMKDICTVVYPIETFFYGMREFAVRDNNGYVIQLGQDVA